MNMLTKTPTNEVVKNILVGADDNTGTNAKFYAQANGEIFHASIGTSIFSRQSLASFGDGSSAPSITGSEWTETASVTGAGNQTDRRTKIRVRYFKRFGIKNLIVKGFAKREIQSGTGSTNTARIYASIDTDEDFVSVTSSFYQEFQLNLDVSNLADDSFHIVEIEVYAEADGDASAEPPQTLTETKTFLREDVYITSAT